MKKLLLISSIIMLILACKKQECKDTYTISGRLFSDQRGFSEKEEPLKKWEVKFNLSSLKNFGGSSNTFLGSTYTDDYGNFSLTYSCEGNGTGTLKSVEMYISSSSNIITGISYILPINQNIHRDFTETSHARIVCEIDNQSDLDTIYIEGFPSFIFDYGNVQGIVKGKYLAVPIKGVDKAYFGFIRMLNKNLKDFNSRKDRTSYGVSYEALDNKEYLGSVFTQHKGAPYYDTVRIELR